MQQTTKKDIIMKKLEKEEKGHYSYRTCEGQMQREKGNNEPTGKGKQHNLFSFITNKTYKTCVMNVTGMMCNSKDGRESDQK